MFFKVGVLKDFAIFTGKHLCGSHFLKNDSNTSAFLWILRILWTALFTEHLRWLLLLLINLFHATHLSFYTPWISLSKLEVFWCFQGVKKEMSGILKVFWCGTGNEQITTLKLFQNVFQTHNPFPKDRSNRLIGISCTAQWIKITIKDLFSKCDQIRRKLWNWSHSI